MGAVHIVHIDNVATRIVGNSLDVVNARDFFFEEDPNVEELPDFFRGRLREGVWIRLLRSVSDLRRDILGWH